MSEWYELLEPELGKIRQPARYVGGESGSIVKPDAVFRVALCFPDLYEIGMSNQAMAILYSRINAMEGFSCERVFFVEQDFEELLKKKGRLLYGLESGRPVKDFDILAFTIGYELLATNILGVLELSSIPRWNRDRTPSDPIVIAGGPGTANPLPLSEIIDATFVGEAEEAFETLLIQLSEQKQKGATRAELLATVQSSAHIWFQGKSNPVVRSTWNAFSTRIIPDESLATPVFPTPHFRIAQDHGVVEIMRGCPTGCRFCLAGFLYRPFRQKEHQTVFDEAIQTIHATGAREISLNSLSSGDYPGIIELLETLNLYCAQFNISFSLPSLRVTSFPLDVLEKIAKVRKSGLTFAIESPFESVQRSLNKIVDKEKIIAVLKRAREIGWKSAKLYFMIGLPESNWEEEGQGIIDYVLSIQRAVNLEIHVNIASFVPKPGTPFSNEPQIPQDLAWQTLSFIKRTLKMNSKIKVGFHSPFQSHLEGILSRGDEKTGVLVSEAYDGGARFDAWDDLMNKSAWTQVLEARPELVQENRSNLTNIPIALNNYLKEEREKSRIGALTNACFPDCDHPCGLCNANAAVSPAHFHGGQTVIQAGSRLLAMADDKSEIKRIAYLRYQKTGTASYIPHLGLLQIFEKAFIRSGITLSFSQGFNPKPISEFAQPLPVGFWSKDEICSFAVSTKKDSQEMLALLRKVMPSGLQLVDIKILSVEAAKKTGAIMALFDGSVFSVNLKRHSDLFDLLKAVSWTDLHPETTVSIQEEIFSMQISTKGSARKLLNLLEANQVSLPGSAIVKISSLGKSRTVGITDSPKETWDLIQAEYPVE